MVNITEPTGFGQKTVSCLRKGIIRRGMSLDHKKYGILTEKYDLTT